MARGPSQYIPQDMTKTDRILKFNAIFAAYEICNINLKVAICFIKFRLNFSPRYVHFGVRKAAQSQNRASCKDYGARRWRTTPLARKACRPSDDALMRGESRLRKIRIIRIADSLIAKFSADAVARTPLRQSRTCVKFAPIALYFAIKNL